MTTDTFECPTCEVAVSLIVKSGDLTARAVIDCGCPKPKYSSSPRFSMPHIITRRGDPAIFKTLNPVHPEITLRNLKAYISGPISQYLDTHKNAPAFEAAETKLRAVGFTALNPLKTCEDSTAEWEVCMQGDLITMMPCGVVFMLSGWLGSTGCCTEYLLAMTLRIPVLDIETFKPVILSENEWEQLYYNINKKARENCVKLFPIL